MYEWLFLALVLLNLADIVSTSLCLRHPQLRECNPLLDVLFTKIGFLPAMFVVKMPILGLLFSLHHFTLVSPICNMVIISTLTLLYVGVLVSNCTHLSKVQ